MFYLGAFIDMLGSYSSSVAKAMMSTLVPQKELGKVMATLESLISLGPMIVIQGFTELWDVRSIEYSRYFLLRVEIFFMFPVFFCQATKDSVPGAVMFLSAGLGFVSVGLSVFLYVDLRGKRFAKTFQEDDIDKDRIDLAREQQKEIEPE